VHLEGQRPSARRLRARRGERAGVRQEPRALAGRGGSHRGRQGRRVVSLAHRVDAV